MLPVLVKETAHTLRTRKFRCE